MDDLLNTKFCISTGHWITYECLLSPTCESITIEDMLQRIEQPNQVIYSPHAKHDDALEECRKQLNKAYNDIELINKDLETIAYPVELFSCGTVLNCGGWEAFCIVNSEQLADLMRHNGAKVMVIH